METPPSDQNGEDQLVLFENAPAWTKYWVGMPEFIQEDLAPRQTVKVHFDSDQSRREFARLVGQTVTPFTQSIWYPEAEIGRIADKRYITRKPVHPKYPLYVISKGRWEKRLTIRALEQIGLPFSVVIEPQEYDEYARVIDPKKILVLPFSNLGQGSIPARNWVWDDAVRRGTERHWIIDDNIDGFYRLNRNLKVKVETGATFRAAEEFTDRYENVVISGFNYFMFASRKEVFPPITLNTRIYSCILIRNDIPYRWRGRYNEDTDLSLRVLKDGWCTVLFNAFLALKQTTMTQKGGNTDELYKDDGRLKMAQSLQEQHPDVAAITWKWGRWQHQVDYSPFKKNRLIPKPGVEPSDGINDFGMELIRGEELERWLAERERRRNG